MVAPNDDSGRDARGRFAAGNPGGPGGYRRRAFEIRRAVEEAITPEVAVGIMRRAARMALEGNLSAIRFVLERVAGRPADVPLATEPVDIALPRLESARACAAATDKVLDGVVKGAVDRETAEVLLEGIQIRLKAIEAEELEARLTSLERMVKDVRLPDVHR